MRILPGNQITKLGQKLYWFQLLELVLMLELEIIGVEFGVIQLPMFFLENLEQEIQM